MARLAKALGTDIQSLAQLLQSHGRGKDKILAHITPKEAARLKAQGGRGSLNPKTGLLEFDDSMPALDIPTVDVQPQPIDVTANMPSVDTGGGVSYGGAPTADFSGGGAAPTFDTSGGYQPSAGGGGSPILDAAGAVPPPSMASATAGLDTTPAPSVGPVEGDQSTWEKISSALGGPQGLARLGITGVGGLLGVNQARKAAEQIKQQQGQETAIAQPYQAQGRSLMGAATQGQMSPASMQAYQALQAQLNQGIANRGGVGAEQAASQLEAFRQQLLANQYNLGLQISQIGDNIALGAIKTGMQLDQQLAQVNQQFYTQLASLAVGLPIAGGQRNA